MLALAIKLKNCAGRVISRARLIEDSETKDEAIWNLEGLKKEINSYIGQLKRWRNEQRISKGRVLLFEW